MPKIPVYQEQQVRLNEFPAPRVNTRVIPNFGGLATAIVGVAAGETALRAIDEADGLRAQDAVNQLRMQQNKLAFGGKDDAGNDVAGAFSVNGENVLKREGGKAFSDEFISKFDAQRDSISATLSNENQRRKYIEASDRLRATFGEQLMRHEANETEKYKDTVYKTTVEVEKDSALKNYNDPISVLDSIERVKDATAAQAKRKGLNQEGVDLAVKDAVSGIHTIVINRLLETRDTKAAKNYMEFNKDNMAEKQATALMGAIEKDEKNGEVVMYVDEVYGRIGPKGDREPVQKDKMLTEITKRFANDDDQLSKAKSLLDAKVQAHDYSVRQRDASIVGGVWKQVLAGRSESQLMQSNEFRALDAKDQASILREVKSFRHVGDGEGGMAQFAAYYELASNPKKLAAMTENEIFANAKTFGPSLTKQLLNKKAELAGGTDGEIAVQVDMDMLKGAAKKNGIKVDSPGKQDKAALGDLEYRAKTLIQSEQSRLKRPLSVKEKNEIYDTLSIEVPVRMKSKGWLGGESYSYENKRVYEVQYEGNIGTPAQREQVMKAYKAKGIDNPTPAQIIRGIGALNKK